MNLQAHSLKFKVSDQLDVAETGLIWSDPISSMQTEQNPCLQELSVKEIRRVFQDTGFPLIAPYLDFISAGLDPERYRGGCWPLAQPESLASAKDAWADINEQLDSCRQLALMAESALGINAEQEPLYGSFEVSPQGQALWLCPE